MRKQLLIHCCSETDDRVQKGEYHKKNILFHAKIKRKNGKFDFLNEFFMTIKVFFAFVHYLHDN